MRSLNLIQTLTVSTLLVGAFVFSTGVANANPNDYRNGMKGLAGAVDAWVAEVEMTADAAVAKPEIACSAQMAELTRRGGYLIDDLSGTGRDVPAALAGAHEALTASVATMTQATMGACTNPVGTVETVQDAKAGYTSAMNRIHNFVGRAFVTRGR